MMESCGSSLTQKYDVGKLLGQGTFAKVHHGRNRMTNMAVAIKTIDKEKIFRVGMIDQIKREISVMRLVRHPHVVQLYEVMASKSRIYFIMEYVKGGELFDRVLKGRLKEDAARKYFQQLISAVEYCHSQGVYHRDIKPENLLLDEDGNLKVSDFGLSALAASKHQDGLLHTTCGTPAYVAPEVILRKGYEGSKADIWSCGVVLFVLLAGFLPFQDSNLMEMYRKIEKAEFEFPRWFPEEACKLIIEILDPNPVTRISMKEIMENPWFQTGLHPGLVQFDDKGQDVVDSKPRNMNAFDIISLSAGFDLSSLFEHSGRVEEVWFSSRQPAAMIVSRLEEVAGCLGLKTRKEKGVLRLENSKVVIDAEIFEVAPSVHLVEMKRLGGDAVDYQRMMDEGIRPALESIVWTCRGETG